MGESFWVAVILLTLVAGAVFLLICLGALVDGYTPRVGGRPATHGTYRVARPSIDVTLGFTGIALTGMFISAFFIEAMSHDHPAFLGVILLTIADLFAFLYCAWSGRAEVGSDGLDFRHRVFGSRFVPYGTISGTSMHDDGERFDVRWIDRRGRARKKTLVAQRRVRDVVERLRLEASHTHDLAETAHALTPELLGQASLGIATQYRIAAPTREELWRVVEAGNLRPESRVLAARAIAATFVGEEAKRLRVVASDTPDEDLRMQLEDLSRTPLARTAPRT